jgi:hypothetical protein
VATSALTVAIWISLLIASSRRHSTQLAWEKRSVDRMHT